MGTEIFVIQRCQLLEKESTFLLEGFILKKQVIILKSIFLFLINFCVIMQVNLNIVFNSWGFINIHGHQFMWIK